MLVNLTAVTTSMSVNQLRGRSIRLDPDEPEKLADNWDVVCIAPEFAKGLDDYGRFIDRHKTIYGLTDDGAIEKGVGHVHAAFTELKPEGLEGSLAGAQRRDARPGGPAGRVPRAVADRRAVPPGADPRAGGRTASATSRGRVPAVQPQSSEPWTGASLALAVGHAVLGALHEARLLRRRYRLHAGDRAGGYVRVFLENARRRTTAPCSPSRSARPWGRWTARAT